MAISCLSYNFRDVTSQHKKGFVFTDNQNLVDLYQILKREFSINDFLILGTCNRTEFYFLEGDITAIQIFLENTVFRMTLVEGLEVKVYSEDSATLKHLFAVATGCESQVLGDCQVVFQLKEAYKVANELNDLSGEFHHLIHQVFKLNKRVTNETKLKEGETSVASSAVNLMSRLVKSKKETPILLIGLGQNGQDTLKNLLQAGYRNITLCNRTFSTAQLIAEKYQLKVRGLEELPELINEHKAIFVSVGSNKLLIDEHSFDWRAIEYHYTYFLDLCAVPSIDVVIEDNPCYEVYGLSYMTDRNEETLNGRKQELEKVRRIIAEETNEYIEQRVVANAANRFLENDSANLSIDSCEFLEEFLKTNTEMKSTRKISDLAVKAKTMIEKRLKHKL